MIEQEEDERRGEERERDSRANGNRISVAILSSFYFSQFSLFLRAFFFCSSVALSLYPFFGIGLDILWTEMCMLSVSTWHKWKYTLCLSIIARSPYSAPTPLCRNKPSFQWWHRPKPTGQHRETRVDRRNVQTEWWKKRRHLHNNGHTQWHIHSFIRTETYCNLNISFVSTTFLFWHIYTLVVDVMHAACNRILSDAAFALCRRYRRQRVHCSCDTNRQVTEISAPANVFLGVLSVCVCVPILSISLFFCVSFNFQIRIPVFISICARHHVVRMSFCRV